MENDEFLGRLNLMLVRQSREIDKLTRTIELLEKRIYQDEWDDKLEKIKYNDIWEREIFGI